MLDQRTALGFLLVMLLLNLFSYYMLRVMIESIVWCDKGGKYNSLAKLKKSVAFFERMKMNYLEQYTHSHRKNFLFWLRCKRIFVIVELLFTLVYVLFVFLIKFHVFFRWGLAFIYLQSFLFSVILFFQTNVHRNTKYDKEREQRKKQ